MIKLNFIINGGLGNQIFQYLASKYISQNFSHINISYKISEHIQSGYRNFELNNLLIQPLKTSYLKKRLTIKILNKIIENLPLLKDENKSRLKFHSNLLNNLYLESRKFSKFNDPLFQLNQDLNSLQFKKRILNICGFWQNPTSYISDLENYMSSFIDTKNLIPKNIEPGKYITIHIRREDFYLNKKSIIKNFSKFSPIKFIILSLQLLPQDYQNMPIILFSDDLSWKLKILEILQKSTNKKITCIKNTNKFQDWSILRHSFINICSNSTFSYSAALLNIENKDSKLRCILPQWINNDESAFEKGWLDPEGFIEI